MLFKIRNKILLCQFNNDIVSIPIRGKKSIEEYIDGGVWDACLGVLEDGNFVSGFGCEDIKYEGIENVEDIAWIDSFSEKLNNISGIVLEYTRDDWHTGDPYYSNIFLVDKNGSIMRGIFSDNARVEQALMDAMFKFIVEYTEGIPILSIFHSPNRKVIKTSWNVRYYGGEGIKDCMDSWVNYGFPKVSEGMYNRIVSYSNNQEAYFCIICEAAEKIKELKSNTAQN